MVRGIIRIKMKKTLLKLTYDYFWLLIIFLLALFLRVYRLNQLPFNFHEDEVLSGYVGRFILQNGKDLYGNPWPLLYFNKFGDYYIILPIYLSGIATYIFGINELATRFPAAFFGALVVFPVFALSFWTFRNKTVALLSSFFISITPWHLVLSRSTTEGVIGSTVFAIAIVFLLNSIRKYSFRWLVFGAVLFFISYFIYHPFRLYVPLFFLGCLLILPQIKKKKKLFLSFILLTGFFFSLSYYISTTVWGRGRFLQTSIFSPLSGVEIRINQQIFQEGQGKILTARLFHNKLIGYGREFIKQYLTYFSPNFLFIDGWAKSRYVVPEQGPLYFTFIILLLAAVILFSKEFTDKINKQYLVLLVYLLLISPLPAAFTVAESPYVHRALFLTIPLAIFSAFGFYKLTKIKFGKMSLSYWLVLFIFLEFVYFCHQYSHHMDVASSLVRNDGQKQVALFVKEKEKKFDKIFLPAEGAMSWYYLFFNKDFNPSYIGKFKLDARIDKTNKIYYVENSCPSRVIKPEDFSNQKILIIDRPQCPSSDKFRLTNKIQGINPLLKYKVFTN